MVTLQIAVPLYSPLLKLPVNYGGLQTQNRIPYPCSSSLVYLGMCCQVTCIVHTVEIHGAKRAANWRSFEELWLSILVYSRGGWGRLGICFSYCSLTMGKWYRSKTKRANMRRIHLWPRAMQTWLLKKSWPSWGVSKNTSMWLQIFSCKW